MLKLKKTLGGKKTYVNLGPTSTTLASCLEPPQVTSSRCIPSQIQRSLLLARKEKEGYNDIKCPPRGAGSRPPRALRGGTSSRCWWISRRRSSSRLVLPLVIPCPATSPLALLSPAVPPLQTHRTITSWRMGTAWHWHRRLCNSHLCAHMFRTTKGAGDVSGGHEVEEVALRVAPC